MESKYDQIQLTDKSTTKSGPILPQEAVVLNEDLNLTAIEVVCSSEIPRVTVAKRAVGRG